jgi:hypothetical protein
VVMEMSVTVVVIIIVKIMYQDCLYNMELRNIHLVLGD